MRTTHLTTVLAAPAPEVWSALRQPATFRAITRGLVRFRPLDGRDEPWREGETVTGPLLLGGVLPFSRHRITVVGMRQEGERYVLRSEEGGGLIRRWKHLIVVTPVDEDRCVYEDRIDVEAGPLTWLVHAFAEGFYRIRQRRWRRLAATLPRSAAPAPGASVHVGG